MAKFVKIKLTNHDREEYQWRLILESIEDIAEYSEFDSHYSFSEYFSELTAKHPQGLRAQALKRLEVGAPKGKSQLEYLASIFDQKAMGMLKTLQRLGFLCVNHAGGYCDLEGFLKTWNGTIIETVYKNSFGFPIEDKIFECDTIVLENSNTFGEDLSASKYGVVKIITNLRGIDIDYIVKCIEQAKNVYVDSQFIDVSQLDLFLKLFLTISRKTIYLKLDFNDSRARLEQHPLYLQNKNKHNINFV